jgi:hypothetical protein
MAKKWENIEVMNFRAENAEQKVYERVIEEVARMIYAEVCQLHEIPNLDSLTLEDQFLQRTGTDA